MYKIEHSLKPSVFYVGDETGALYAQMRNGRMLCLDANGSSQVAGYEYHQNHGSYTSIASGTRIIIEVGK